MEIIYIPILHISGHCNKLNFEILALNLVLNLVNLNLFRYNQFVP